MTPYYTDELVALYHADFRDLPPFSAPAPDTIITDPVWPNARVEMAGSEDPEGLFRDLWAWANPLPKRAAIHLGCDSDPRFLLAVPDVLPFFRVAWLEYARMSYKGRLGNTGDVAYLFGAPPASRPGHRIIPGRYTDTSPEGKGVVSHPSPRHVNHAKWLVRWWTDPGDVVLDPFAGSGTTLAACKALGRFAVGVEVEERWCEEAAERCQQTTLHLVEPEKPPLPTPEPPLELEI